MHDGKRLCYVFYGCHGVGKTYVAVRFAEWVRGHYICTDFAESLDFVPESISCDSIQERYFEYLQKAYRSLIEGNISHNNDKHTPLVVDFGFYQEVPYIKYHKIPSLEEKLPLIEKYESQLDEVYDVRRILVVAPYDTVRKRIIKRAESKNRNVEWELQSLHKIYHEFLNLAEKMPGKFLLWNNE